jgi:hypothetical protein
MARGRSVIVGGGLAAVGTLLAGALLEVATADPPAVQLTSVTGVPAATFARTNHVIVGPSNQILGVGRYTASTPSGVVLIGSSSEIQAGITGGGQNTNNALVIGNAAILRSTGGQLLHSTIIGNAASAISASSINNATVIGAFATYTGTGTSVLVGSNSASSGQNAVGVGYGVSVTAANSTAVGAQSGCSGARNVALGDTATANTGTDSVCIGQGASMTGTRSINIGGTGGAFDDAITLNGTAFQNNTVVIGGRSGNAVTTVLVGKGNTSATPSALLFRLTNAVGTDIAASDFTIQAGLGTGAGLPGAVSLNVGVQGGSGTGLQASRPGVVVQFSAVAGDTYLMVYDVNGASLKRVTVGANDSGGAGFKLLRIVN